MEQFDLVYARLTPRRLRTLKQGVADFIGLAATWEAYWIIESGRYEGQWSMHMLPEEASQLGWGFYWVPEEDLTILAAVARQQGGEEEG